MTENQDFPEYIEDEYMEDEQDFRDSLQDI